MSVVRGGRVRVIGAARGVVGVVRLDARDQRADVGRRCGLVRAILEAEVRRHRDREQDAENDDDDEELDQGETLIGAHACLEAVDHVVASPSTAWNGGWLRLYRPPAVRLG